MTATRSANPSRRDARASATSDSDSTRRATSAASLAASSRLCASAVRRARGGHGRDRVVRGAFHRGGFASASRRRRRERRGRERQSPRRGRFRRGRFRRGGVLVGVLVGIVLVDSDGREPSRERRRLRQTLQDAKLHAGGERDALHPREERMRARVGRFAKPRRFRSERRARAPQTRTRRDASRRSTFPRRETRDVARGVLVRRLGECVARFLGVVRRARRPTQRARLGGGKIQRAGVRSPPVGRSHDEFAVRIVHARAVHPRSGCASAGRDAASARRRRSGRAAGSKPPDDNADASRVKKRRRPETVRIRSNPRARRETMASRVAREDAACAREPREASRHQRSPKWRRSRRRRRRRSGSTSCRSARRAPPTRRVRFASRRACADASGAPARSAARRRATALGSARKAASCALRIARVVAAAACVARLADSRTRRLEDSPNPNPPEPRNPRPIPNPELSLANARRARGAPLRRRRQRRERRRHRARARGWKTKRRTLAIPERVCSYRGRRRAFARERARRRRDGSSSVAVAGPAPPEKRRAAGRRCASYARPNAREPRVMKAPHAGRMSPKSQPSVRAFEEDEDVAAANHASASPFASEGDASSSRRTSRVSEGFGVGFESFESSHSGVKMSPARRSASHAGSRNPPRRAAAGEAHVQRGFVRASFRRNSRSRERAEERTVRRGKRVEERTVRRGKRVEERTVRRGIEPATVRSRRDRSERERARARRRVHLDVDVRPKALRRDGVVGGGESIVSAPETGRRLENRRGGETEPRARALGASRGGGIVTRGYRERGCRSPAPSSASRRTRSEALEVLRGSGRAAVRDVVSRLSTRPREGEGVTRRWRRVLRWTSRRRVRGSTDDGGVVLESVVGSVSRARSAIAAGRRARARGGVRRRCTACAGGARWVARRRRPRGVRGRRRRRRRRARDGEDMGAEAEGVVLRALRRGGRLARVDGGVEAKEHLERATLEAAHGGVPRARVASGRARSGTRVVRASEDSFRQRAKLTLEGTRAVLHIATRRRRRRHGLHGHRHATRERRPLSRRGHRRLASPRGGALRPRFEIVVVRSRVAKTGARATRRRDRPADGATQTPTTRDYGARLAPDSATPRRRRGPGDGARDARVGVPGVRAGPARGRPGRRRVVPRAGRLRLGFVRADRAPDADHRVRAPRRPRGRPPGPSPRERPPRQLFEGRSLEPRRRVPPDVRRRGQHLPRLRHPRGPLRRPHPRPDRRNSASRRRAPPPRRALARAPRPRARVRVRLRVVPGDDRDGSPDVRLRERDARATRSAGTRATDPSARPTSRTTTSTNRPHPRASPSPRTAYSSSAGSTGACARGTSRDPVVIATRGSPRDAVGKTIPGGGLTGCVAPAPLAAGSRLVAAGSYDRTVRVFDATTGEVALAFEGHAGGVTRAVWSPDGGTCTRAREGTRKSRVGTVERDGTGVSMRASDRVHESENRIRRGTVRATSRVRRRRWMSTRVRSHHGGRGGRVARRRRRRRRFRVSSVRVVRRRETGDRPERGVRVGKQIVSIARGR